MEYHEVKELWGSMSTNTIYFGENEKTLGFTTLIAKLIKGRGSLHLLFFNLVLLSRTLVVHGIPRSKGAWGSMSTNTIYFGENEKTLGFTTLVAKLIKGRISCLYTVQPPTTTVHALRAPLWRGLWSAWRGGSARVHSLACVCGHSARR